MENICTLEPRAVWKIFAEICAIPHPSGHEKALADAIAAMAEQHGLKARRDAYGNLRIDRAASPGFETRSTVILQGHLDMVPQAEAGSLFDFEKDPIPAVADGGFVRSAAGTTLGGDNGIGVAAALALLFDESFHSGPLAAVFTLSEEIGLNGATALDPAFLAGKYLLNLDSEDEGELFIGCAGGARLEASFAPEYETPSPSFAGALLEVKGLAGGHSGCNIADRRGNAVQFLGAALLG
ncbi:MAG TPA: cytosol nonspecific dipeptidase, partial [Lentisphaeria bacterium]|nr:cytosol nonspecific dipeptidase [Lentisphaeria bacterium]